jgi:mannose-6-phosphate isomerase-like protein (cupin superfamily)
MRKKFQFRRWRSGISGIGKLGNKGKENKGTIEQGNKGTIEQNSKRIVSRVCVLYDNIIKENVVSKINIKEKLSLFSDHWKPKIIGDLNDCHVKLAKFKGEFVWHHHEKEDELFFVLKGRFLMKFRTHEVWIEEGEMIIVPKGVEHMPVADEEVQIMLIEPTSTLNTGNVASEKTLSRLDRI